MFDIILSLGIAPKVSSVHSVNSGSEMVWAKHVYVKNTFLATLIAKSREGDNFEFLLCAF